MCTWAVFDGNFCKKHLIHLSVRLFEIVLLLFLLLLLLLLLLLCHGIAVVVVSVQYRGCADTFLNGCHSASTSDLKGPAKILANLYPEDVSGTACFCDSDMCDAKCTGVMVGTTW